MSINANETFGLLGPNGAGKTTTISMLTGLFPPTSGTATISGFDIVKEIDQVHLVIGICPQFDVHWPNLTVEEHLLFYARMKGIAANEEAIHIKEMAGRVGLEADLKKKSSELSGGMRRRLSVAIAFIGNPQIVSHKITYRTADCPVYQRAKGIPLDL
jgi:ABC-type multidrug transport system ATPase subunit